MTAPSDHLTAHHAAARQLLEALSDLRPSLFRELAEGAVHLMVDAANALEQRADAAAAVLTHAGEVVDVLEELTEALRDASPAVPGASRSSCGARGRARDAHRQQDRTEVKGTPWHMSDSTPDSPGTGS